MLQTIPVVNGFRTKVHERTTYKVSRLTLDVQLSKVQLDALEQLWLGQWQGMLDIALQIHPCLPGNLLTVWCPSLQDSYMR